MSEQTIVVPATCENLPPECLPQPVPMDNPLALVLLVAIIIGVVASKRK